IPLREIELKHKRCVLLVSGAGLADTGGSARDATYHRNYVSRAWRGLVAPLKIFLSYGHDSNEELVRRIKSDLETRGHEVWFDRSAIRAGDDWRRAITDGILASHRVLSFLSRHSIRDPGVCLDEIAIAVGVKGSNIQTILVEREGDVRPPPSISHIQWLDMRDWKEQRAAGEAAWEDWYGAKLAEIVRVVESEETKRFAGEIEDLNHWLMPISSESRVSGLLAKPFVGRDWLLDSVEQWRSAADRSSRLFWILGDPGVGKSAFAARLAHYGRDRVLAAQFVEWDKPDHRDPRRVVRSLAFQLATRLPEYRKLLLTLPELAHLDRKDPAELFDYLLANPLRTVIKGGRQRHLIIVDALDEAEEDGLNPLADLLARDAQRLPDWIVLLVTSRPESAVKTPLQGLKPFIIDTRMESNRADIRAYIRHELEPQFRGRPDAEPLVEQILEKSEGIFLYVEIFRSAVQRNDLSLDHPEQFPTGLGGTFFQYLRRLFPSEERFRKEVRAPLRAILAAREPLPIAILQRYFRWEDEDLRDFTRPLASLFPVTDTGERTIRPYHKSLADFLTDETKAGAYFVSSEEGHRLLANAFQAELATESWSEPCYWGRHARTHLTAVGALIDGKRPRKQRQRRSAVDESLAVAFLQSRSDCEAEGVDLAACVCLAKIMGNVPLALEQAAAYICEQGPHYGFADYLRDYDRAAAELSGEGIVHPKEYPDVVAETWLPSVQRLGAAARTVLRLCAFFSAMPIPITLLLCGSAVTRRHSIRFGSDPSPLAEDEVEFWVREALIDLRAYSLIRLEGRTVSFHPLLRKVELLNIPAADLDADRHAAVALYLATPPLFGWQDDQRGNWSRAALDEWRLLLPHGQVLLDLPGERDPELLARVGGAMAGLGDWQGALPLFTEAYQRFADLWGDNDPRTLVALEDVGYLQRYLGHAEESLRSFRDSEARRWAAQGPEHEGTLRARHNQAIAETLLGHWNDAEIHIRAVAEIRKRVLGPDHYDTVTSLHDLGWMLSSAGRKPETQERCFRDAIAAWESALGPEHPDTLASLNNLALLLQDTGRADEAEPLLRRSMEARRQAYGPLHPAAANGVASYALVLMRLGRDAEAKSFAEEALDIWAQTSVPEDSRSGKAHWILGVAAEQGSNGDGAVTHLRQALHLFLKGHPADHPWVREVRANLERLVREN
ncbi:toll/interleukin-1 receptor domain-containing protein, partial [uncultured Lamprocystis sp.]